MQATEAYDYDPVRIGARLFEFRSALRLSQFDVAEAAKISLRTYADIERGESNMRVGTLLSICRALKVRPNDVLLENPDGAESYELTDLVDQFNETDERMKRTAVKVLRAMLF